MTSFCFTTQAQRPRIPGFDSGASLRLCGETTRKRKTVCCSVVFWIVLLLAGCSKEPAEQATVFEPALTRQYRRDSTTIIVSLSETNITTAGKILLMLDVHVPADLETVVPEILDLIEPFTVADRYSEPIQALPNGKQLHRHVWVLVPGLPGAYRFLPLEINVGSVSIRTEPVHIGVASLLPADIDGFEIKDISAPETRLPEEKRRNRMGLVLTGTALSIIVLALGIKIFRRPRQTILPSPSEEAFQALNQLPADELSRIQALTGILLAFIERRLQVGTTGKTLNEIIPSLSEELLPNRKEPLIQLLRSSEQVRFSNRVPCGFGAELEAFIRSFIEELEEVACD